MAQQLEEGPYLHSKAMCAVHLGEQHSFLLP